MRAWSRVLTVSLLLLGLAPLLAERDPFIPSVVAIKARRIETVSKGVVADGVVVIRNGKIAAVGKAADTRIPVGATVIDAGEGAVIPGLVLAASTLGLSGPANGINPHYRAFDELYPHQRVYERAAQLGVTTIALAPTGNGIPGQGVIVQPTGATPEAMAIVKEGTLSVGFSTAEQNTLRQTFENARKFLQPPPLGQPAPTPTPRETPIVRALKGELPTLIAVSSPAEVLYATRIFDPLKLKATYLLSGADTYRAAATLGASKANVLLRADIPFDPGTRDRLNLPEIYRRAGCAVALLPPDDTQAGLEQWLFKVGELVKAGFARDAALRALTLTPAEMLNLNSRVGSIDTGRDGNLIILDGDPFTPTTKIRQVLIAGEVVSREAE